MLDLFDGVADIRHYARDDFRVHPCELLAFEDYSKYTVTYMSFEGRDTYLFIVKAPVSVEATPQGTFEHYIHSGVALAFSVGGLSYCIDSTLIQSQEKHEISFIGFDALGNLRLIPNGGIAAVNSGIVYGADASPFLVVNGKRLVIRDGEKRSRDRLLLGQLRSGEIAFIYIKGVDVSRAADYALQLGCYSAAVIANERRIDIYSKSILQDRQSGCRASFVIH